MYPNNKHYAGFSLLEMLIALLVLSIGLLGVATLQIRGQQFNQVGYLRTQATFFAYDIMERMRLNLDNIPNNNTAEEGVYDYPGGGNFVDKGPSNSNNTNDDCDDNDPDNACSTTELRNYDLDNWFNMVRETLPEGKANIAWDATDQTYTITITWTNIIDRGDDSKPEQQQWILQL
jgi:type IV pilus assembly protein PilV